MSADWYGAVTAPFDDSDKEREDSAFKQVFQIPTMTLISELYVTRTLFLHLTLIAQHIVILPLWSPWTILTNRFHSAEAQHSIGVFLALALAFSSTFFLPVSYEAAFELLRSQSIYKLWAVYTLVKIVMRHAVKMHVFGHRVLRGAVRTGSFPRFVVGVFVHAVITTIYFYLFAMYMRAIWPAFSGSGCCFSRRASTSRR
jgi:hypothetical protein